MFIFLLGGGLLLTFGWLPHWARHGIPPWTRSVGFVVFIGACLAFGIVQKVLYYRWRHRVPRQNVERARTITAVILLIMLPAAAAGWLAWAPSPGTGEAMPRAANLETPVPEGPPVIVLLLDTLRWDSLSCYGHAAALTPNLDRFCREAVQFETARAQASWTKPSIATLLTGTYPEEHGARARSDRIHRSSPVLARLFRRAGYSTAAVVANGNLSPAFGFSRGFGDYRYLRPDFALGGRGRALGLGSYRIATVAWQRVMQGRREHRFFKRNAAEVNREVLDWLDGASGPRPFFLFVNYVDPHDPYFRHPYDGRALGAVDGKSPARSERDEMALLYDGEVAFLDRHLGRLFAELRRRGLYDRSLIVVTSDHGEEFLDHGGWWHGLTLFEEQVRVPLLVRLPHGGRRGERIAGTAGLVDLGPTLLELAGQGARIPERMSGLVLASLTGDGSTGTNAPRSFPADELLDGNRLASLVEGRWKFVRANPDNPRGLPSKALYDIVDDPGETRNLVADHPELAAAMDLRLSGFQQRGSTGTEGEGPATLDEETAAHLRALGYLH
jgi:arylsulfatase A-like enzyme